VCYRNLSTRGTVYEIFDFKNVVTLKTGLQESVKTFYSNSISVVSEIFKVAKYSDLEIPVKDNQDH